MLTMPCAGVTLCFTQHNSKVFPQLPWEGVMYLECPCPLCLQQNPSFVWFFFPSSALCRQTLPPLLMPDRVLAALYIHRSTAYKHTQHAILGPRVTVLTFFCTSSQVLWDDWTVRNADCLWSTPPPTPSVNVQDYNGGQLKGMYNFSPGCSIIYILDKRKSNSFFFFPPAKEVFLFRLKAEPLRRKERSRIVKRD